MLSVALTQHSNRVSTKASSRRRETQFSRAETKDPKTVPAIQSADCRDKRRAQIAANSGRFALNWEISVCAGLRGGGCSRSRTGLSNPNSLLTGKNTGKFIRIHLMQH